MEIIFFNLGKTSWFNSSSGENKISEKGKRTSKIKCVSNQNIVLQCVIIDHRHIDCMFICSLNTNTRNLCKIVLELFLSLFLCSLKIRARFDWFIWSLNQRPFTYKIYASSYYPLSITYYWIAREVLAYILVMIIIRCFC